MPWPIGQVRSSWAAWFHIFQYVPELKYGRPSHNFNGNTCHRYFHILLMEASASHPWTFDSKVFQVFQIYVLSNTAQVSHEQPAFWMAFKDIKKHIFSADLQPSMPVLLVATRARVRGHSTPVPGSCLAWPLALEGTKPALLIVGSIWLPSGND